jgi:hypothetical protein
MKTLLTITDVTRMDEGRVCVAGYTHSGQCIRLSARQGISEEWLYTHAGRVIIQPFAAVEVFLLGGSRKANRPPHTEDQPVSLKFRVRRGMLNTAHRRDFLHETCSPDLSSIFQTPPINESSSWYVMRDTGKHSLGTLGPLWVNGVSLTDTDVSPRLIFDHNGVAYRLPIVDLTFRYMLAHARKTRRMAREEIETMLEGVFRKRETFLRIGLSRGWKKHPERCYVQVTGIYTFPDYLNGRCFADFVH